MIRTLACLTLLALTACGGGSSSGGTAKGIDYTSAQSIAVALDKGGFTCTGYTPNKEVLMAREEGTCDHDDSTVSITIYQSKDQRLKVEKAFEALASGIPVRGDAWAISTDSKADAVQVQKIVGGQVE